MRYGHICRPPLNLGSSWPVSRLALAFFQRSVRHQAFDARFDHDELAEARKWHQSFSISSLPEGNTTFSRSSGPGGQHVNKFVMRRLQTARLLSVLTRPEQKQRQQPRGPFHSCYPRCRSCCMPASGHPSITPSETTASPSRRRLSAAAVRTPTRTARNSVKNSKPCIAAQCPV